MGSAVRLYWRAWRKYARRHKLRRLPAPPAKDPGLSAERPPAPEASPSPSPAPAPAPAPVTLAPVAVAPPEMPPAVAEARVAVASPEAPPAPAPVLDDYDCADLVRKYAARPPPTSEPAPTNADAEIDAAVRGVRAAFDRLDPAVLGRSVAFAAVAELPAPPPRPPRHRARPPPGRARSVPRRGRGPPRVRDALLRGVAGDARVYSLLERPTRALVLEFHARRGARRANHPVAVDA